MLSSRFLTPQIVWINRLRKKKFFYNWRNLHTVAGKVQIASHQRKRTLRSHVNYWMPLFCCQITSQLKSERQLRVAMSLGRTPSTDCRKGPPILGQKGRKTSPAAYCVPGFWGPNNTDLCLYRVCKDTCASLCPETCAVLHVPQFRAF
jgi:hypothetical protein